MGGAQTMEPRTVSTRLVFPGPLEAVLEESEIPPPGANELLLRAQKTGISVGTELALYRGIHPNLRTKKWGYWTDYPLYPGYEFAGVVEAVGRGVTGFAPGDRVIALAPHGSWAIAKPESTAILPDEVEDD